ncbi:MAG: hypothetical protein RR338_04390 [Clostridia bacterium]
MNFAKVVFVAVDKLFNHQQNERKTTKYKDVEFVVEKDIVYDNADPKACNLDTYYVKKEGKYPVLFYIHGGGFVAGDKFYRRGR